VPTVQKFWEREPPGGLEPVQAIIGIVLLYWDMLTWVIISLSSSIMKILCWIIFFFMLNGLSIYNTQHIGLVVT
jgi:hypothetical protein